MDEPAACPLLVPDAGSFAMVSRPVTLALVAIGCMAAAGVGAYVAVRESRQAVAAGPVAAVAAAPAASPAVAPVAVAETEAAVDPAPRRAAAPALTLFVVQLAVNALWSWPFFRWHRGALALVDVALLWLLILATLLMFWRVSTLAGMLLVPYLAWATFASVLNYTVWRLNPQQLG